MPIRKKPYPGEMIEIFMGHQVIEVSEDRVTIEVTRFKGINPAGMGRINIPIGYLEYCEVRRIFSLKREYLDWFGGEMQKLNC